MKSNYELENKQRNQRIEQQQLIGYWAKTQGFSLKTLEKADANILQALRLATNIIKNIPGEHKEVYKDCNNLLQRFKTGKKIDTKLLGLIYRHSRRIQRQQAKNTRKATR